MPQPPISSPNALRASSRVLKVAVALNLLSATFIAAIVAGLAIDRDWTMTAIGIRETSPRDALLVGMLALAAFGSLGILVMHRILRGLQAIVATVREGDPFVPDNAVRLEAIAWNAVWLELLHLGVGAVATAMDSPAQPFDVDWSFSFTPWVAVLMLFVLARVFAHGTRLRDDLEGVV